MVPSDGDRTAPAEESADLVRLPRKTPEEFASFARHHPRAAARAFDALPFDERMHMAAAARGKTRLDLLLLSSDAAAMVQAFPAVDLLMTLKEVGDDAADLLSLASSRQIRLFVDLDAWRGDRFDPKQFEEWISLLHDSGEKLGEAVAALDIELLVRWFRARLRVWKAESDGALPEGAPEGLMTIDGVYHVEALDAGDDLAVVRAVLLATRERDAKLYWRLLEGVDHEMDSDLETWAFRWRESRLNDEGFPSFDDALPVYARVDRRRLDLTKERKPDLPPPSSPPESPPAGPSTLDLRASPDDLLLTRAWEAGRAAGGWDVLEEELAYLLNRVLVADRTDWDSPIDIRDLFDRATATLNLGLESAAGEKPGEDLLRTAQQLLREVRLEALFRLGFTRTLVLRDAALRAAPEGDDAWTLLLESPLPEALRGARFKRPLLWTEILGDTEPAYRAFRTLPEVEVALDVMRLAGALRLLWEEVSARAVAGALSDWTAGRTPIRLPMLVNTLFAWEMLESRAELRPLPVGRIAGLQRALFSAFGASCADPVIAEGVRTRLHGALAGWA